MSREIKFRAWNIAKKEMERVLQLNFSDKRIRLGGGYYKNFDEVILMQYAGLEVQNQSVLSKSSATFTKTPNC